jgi:hypothetical protein
MKPHVSFIHTGEHMPAFQSADDTLRRLLLTMPLFSAIKSTEIGSTIFSDRVKGKQSGLERLLHLLALLMLHSSHHRQFLVKK